MSIARMTTDGDVAIYAEINRGTSETFQMDINTCYSNIRGTSSKSKTQSNGKESSSTLVRYFILASVLIIFVLAATCACVSFALVEFSKLKSCCIKSDVDIAALQEQLSMFQQNVTEADASIAISLAGMLCKAVRVQANLITTSTENRPHFFLYCSLSPSSPSGYYWVRVSMQWLCCACVL